MQNRRWTGGRVLPVAPHLLVALVTCDACPVPLFSFYIDFGMHVCLYMNVYVYMCACVWCIHMYIHVCAPHSVVKPTSNWLENTWYLIFNKLFFKEITKRLECTPAEDFCHMREDRSDLQH